MVASTVEWELALAGKSLLLAPEEIKRTVNELLKFFDLEKQRLMNPFHLPDGKTVGGNRGSLCPATPHPGAG